MPFSLVTFLQYSTLFLDVLAHRVFFLMLEGGEDCDGIFFFASSCLAERSRNLHIIGIIHHPPN